MGPGDDKPRPSIWISGDAIERLGIAIPSSEARYGNLFDIYEGDHRPRTLLEVPMKIYPARCTTPWGGLVGGLQSFMTNISMGSLSMGEANFSDHGSNRLGASALMQGLADGYFVLPYTVGDYLASEKPPKVSADDPACKQALDNVKSITDRLLNVKGKQTVDTFHRKLGTIMWEGCGMGRTAESLTKALEEIPKLREEFWQDVRVLGTNSMLNQSLEKAGRVADFLEMGELMCRDALERDESCGGHFREEHQTEDGEAVRDDENFSHVAVWEYKGDNEPPALHKEPLEFDYCKPSVRSYK